MRSAVVLVVAAACGRLGFDAQTHSSDGGISDGNGSGSAAPFVPWWHSGPRLRARILDGGGDPIFYGWHDSQLFTDCQAAIASDGVERCMPYSARVGAIFSDAGCTQPLALVTHGTCGSDAYAYDDSSGKVVEYPLGGVYAGTIYANPGACAATSLPSNQEAHVIGAAALPTDFLASTYHHQQVGSFVHSFNDFADGTTIDLGSLVLANTGCTPQLTQLGPAPCRATIPRASLGYTDSACMQPALIWNRTPYDPPSASLFAVFPPQACDTTYTFYKTIADVTAATYYVKQGASCVATTTPANVVMYTATAMADPSPTGTIIKGPDRGRIGTFYWVGSDNTPIAVGNFDQQLGLPCTPFNGTDRKLHCLPAAPASETANENATCAGLAGKLVGECFAVPPLLGPSYPSCIDTPFKVRPLPNTFTAASIEYEGTCTSIDLPNGVGFDPTNPGNELAPAMFPTLTEHVE